MIPCVQTAINIVSAQTKQIRRKLRKNRTRLVYRVETDDGICRNIYNKRRAILLARKHPGGYIWEGKQNSRWIEAGNLTGIRWNKNRQWAVRYIKSKV